MTTTEIRANTRHNFTMNVLDGAFFGMALGFASFVTIIPLFLNTLTDSTVLIGLVASLHTIGWQLPQLLTSGYVSRLRRYKPMVMMLTIHERWPFFGLAVLALLVPVIGPQPVLVLAIIVIAIQSLGGGLAATAWQSMISKIMPLDRRGTFFGMQSGAANLLAAGGAFVAGILLERLPSPYDFFSCFFIAGVAMMVSLTFLARTREPAHELAELPGARRSTRQKMKTILGGDVNFRWFLIARILSQFAWMSVSFYTIYAVRRFNMDPATAGILTSLLMLAQTAGSPILGWLGDRWGHRVVYAFGALLIAVGTLLALAAPGLSWFYLAFGIAGFSNAAIWAVAMSLTLEFGGEAERPVYIGLANTLIAPAGLLAPVVGGWLADNVGFGATFTTSTVCGLLAAGVLYFLVKDPRAARSLQPPVPLQPPLEDAA